MSLILSLTVASAVGTLLGNLSMFMIIGGMAKKQQQKHNEEVQRMQNAFLEIRQKEAERMQRYAKMES
jgi:flagellar motor component MotA